MALKAQVTGTFSLIDESNGNKVEYSADLAAAFGVITNVQDLTRMDRDIVVGDGTLNVPLGGVATIRGILIIVTGSGTVVFKHSTNPNGEEISKAMLLFGEISAPTIETAATQAVGVKVLVFE